MSVCGKWRVVLNMLLEVHGQSKGKKKSITQKSFGSGIQKFKRVIGERQACSEVGKKHKRGLGKCRQLRLPL